ncbi:MAG: hypothetical protein MRJ65_07290 [Candidatus Brocadiaceae bacterium]|nr:hypothetical protein [Candidatus Brocadiaceae bacterium]
MDLSVFVSFERRLRKVCYNCGCQLPSDEMGKGKLSQGGASLTDDDFSHMAEKWGMSIEDTKKNVLKLLKSQLGA